MARIDSPESADSTASHWRIRRSVMLSFGVAAGVMLLFFTLSIQWMREALEEDAYGRVARNLTKAFQSHQDENARTLESLLAIMLDNQRYQDLFLARDRTALLSAVSAIYEQLRRVNHLTHLYFHGPDLVNVLRAHQPDRFGDPIRRSTLLSAQQTGLIARGLELGPNGTFTLRIVSPWRDPQGNTIGFVELGREVQTLLEPLEATLDLDLHLLLNKQFLDRMAWEAGMTLLGRTPQWEQFDQLVIVSDTSSGTSPGLDKHLRYGLRKVSVVGHPRVPPRPLDHRHFVTVPVADTEGRPVARLLAAFDDALVEQITRNSMLVLLASNLGAALLLGLLFYRFLTTLETRLQSKSADLRHSERRLRAILDTALDAIISIDAESRILEFNQAAQKIFGFTREEVLGRDIVTTIMPPELRERHRQGMSRYLATGEQQVINRRIELTAQDAQGSTLPVEVAITVVSEEGSTFFTAYLRDISARKLMMASLQDTCAALEATNRHLQENEETIREAREAAERANQAKSAFLAHMSHEIRTPMNVILGMDELLLETPLNPEQHRLVELSNRAGNALLALINDVLDLSKIEAGQLSLEESLFDLGELVNQTSEILATSAREKGLLLTCHTTGIQSVCVMGDAQRLRQILLNLIGNAIKFTPQGAITIQVAEGDGGGFLIAVQDTGIGIPLDRQETIFAPFTQADNTTSRRFGGTGLGLTICRQLAQAMGGTIQVASVPGQGSRFTLFLPLARSNCPPGHRTPPGQEGLPTPTDAPPLPPTAILLADDAEDGRLLIRAFLKKSNYRLDTVDNGEQAVAAFQRGEYALVIMDVEMPLLDGYEASRRIRAWEAAAGRPPAPIIALTAHALREHAERSLAAGCNLHLTKPVRKHRLLEAIADLLREGSPS